MEDRVLQMTGKEVLEIDQYLKPYERQLAERWDDFKHMVKYIRDDHQGLMKFADNSDYGFFVEQDGKHFDLQELDSVNRAEDAPQPYLVYREWIGNGKVVSIVGEFNDWDGTDNETDEQDFGVFQVRIPFKKVDGEWTEPIPKDSVYKIKIVTHQGEELYRHPIHCVYAILNPEKGQLEPRMYYDNSFEFKAPQPDMDVPLQIYETHIGMASPEPKIASFKHFTEVMLPLIKKKNYNCIQIMAIQEHSFYGSFGYQVTGFFGVSSRYGTPREFKELVERAHELGIIVLLDLVHSHASKNEADGISRWDGSDFLFLKEDHPLWDSKVFNYKHPECLRMLLQNLRYWVEEYNIDGFRFDGCMSMMYWHRSAGVGYTGRYGEYFDDNCRVDMGALTYLRLAHLLFLLMEKKRGKKIITIAEDVSGYPTLASPLL